jgi:hypothetical protein
MSTQNLSQEDIEEIKLNLRQFKKSQEDLLNLLKGNPYNPKDTGVLGTVHATTEKVELLTKWKDRVTYVAIGASLVSVPAGWGIVETIKSLIQP